MKCAFEDCKAEAEYVYEGIDMCSDCVTAHAQKKTYYTAESVNHGE